MQINGSICFLLFTANQADIKCISSTFFQSTLVMLFDKMAEHMSTKEGKL